MDLNPKSRPKFDRIAPIFDLLEWPMERLFMTEWRKRAISELGNGRLLEVGVGTGKNIPYYPPGMAATAVDISRKMLARARRRVAQHHTGQIHLIEADAQALPISSSTFDQALASFTFCSVADPVKGLKELARTVRPGGTIILLEHMRPGSRWMGALFDLLNPLVIRILGDNINRRTLENVEAAGLHIRRVIELKGDIVKIIIATLDSSPLAFRQSLKYPQRPV
jgi:ubiquinone/menaquinone biosynthesis C-methylase UbiE